MFEKRAGLEKNSRIDRLLRVLRLVSERDPSPAIRQQLEILAAQRLRAVPSQKRPRWYALNAAFACALTMAVVVCLTLLVHHRQPKFIVTDTASRSSDGKAAPNNANATAARTEATGEARSGRRVSAMASKCSRRRVTMRLPYSNNAIDTGTDATIRVAVSQAELVSMGFPINLTVEDRRVVAELTLGDDGLPRAISLPLPIEVLKEKK